MNQPIKYWFALIKHSLLYCVISAPRTAASTTAASCFLFCKTLCDELWQQFILQIIGVNYECNSWKDHRRTAADTKSEEDFAMPALSLKTRGVKPSDPQILTWIIAISIHVVPSLTFKVTEENCEHKLLFRIKFHCDSAFIVFTVFLIGPLSQSNTEQALKNSQ